MTSLPGTWTTPHKQNGDMFFIRCILFFTTESLTTKDFHRVEFFASVKFQKGCMNSKNVTRASANKVLSSLRVKFVFLENYLKVVIYSGNALKIETGVFLYSLQLFCYSLCSKSLKI